MVYRTREELEFWKQRDPLTRLRHRLLNEGLAAEADLDALAVAIKREMDEAVAFAIASPAPAPHTALTGVYGETHGGRVF
jgi:TPP-dependent pyruvate/acetoin dehydrogenase alpha subunit